MANMNKKSYWKARKRIKTVLFKIKVLLFKIANLFENHWERRSLRRLVVRNIISGCFKAIIVVLVALSMDSLSVTLFQTLCGVESIAVDRGMFVDVVIGSIGVAGVILGLYCANVSSIYSTRYANVPEKIAIAFQYDQLTRKSMSSIIAFVIFGFATIIEALLDLHIGWFSVMAITAGAIYVLVSYSIAGNRAYQLSDIYRLADDSYRGLYRIINKGLKESLFSADVNFQNHYLKEAEKRIDLLKSIQKFGANEKHGDNTTMVEFICKNFLLLGDYWKNKSSIAKTSLWFRNESKYKKWHLSSDTETKIALHTGTALGVTNERNYWWFEDEIMSINHSCFEVLLEEHDYISFYSCLITVEQLCETAISCKEASYYLDQINRIKNLASKYMVSESDDADTKKAYAGVIEIISVLYLDLILESSKLYSEFKIEDIGQNIIRALDQGHSFEKSPLLSGSPSSEFYKKVLTEIHVEGHRITPIWVIKQCAAKEEYDYLNILVSVICEGIEQTFSFGKEFLDNKLWLESCILLSRFFEFESKLKRFLDIATLRENEFRKFQIDRELQWDDFQIERLNETFGKWKTTVPESLLKCSSEFVFANWENRDSYPDFLGESFNHLCEDAIDSIINGNKTQFKQDFVNLSKLMLLYQEYIRTDFLKEKNKYRSEYMFYMYTSPIVEWAQIGGLAILWGEFGADTSWYEMVDNEAKLILTKNDKETPLAETIIQYIQNRDKFMFGIGNRDILETDWNLRVAAAIRETRPCEVDYSFYGERLKTNSKLIQAFCWDFMDMGFMNNPSEVFWVKIVNPLLSKDKQFHSRFSWEDKLNE